MVDRSPKERGKKMKTKKIYGAMVRLDESTYFELRRIALDHRSTFNRFAREILEQYLVAERRGARRQKSAEIEA